MNRFKTLAAGLTAAALVAAIGIAYAQTTSDAAPTTPASPPTSDSAMPQSQLPSAAGGDTSSPAAGTQSSTDKSADTNNVGKSSERAPKADRN